MLLLQRDFFTKIYSPTMKHCSALLAVSFFFWALTGLSAQNFRVQIAAYTEKMSDTFFLEKGVEEVYVTHNQMGMYCYFARACDTREGAEKVQKELIEKGFPFSVVIDLEEQRVLSNADCPYYHPDFKKSLPKPGSNERNIYFDFGSSDLTAESKTELDAVCQAMKENLALNLKLNAHSDAVGSAQANIELASTRARAARNYLINKGVRADRMFIKVFGEAAPIASNTTEDTDGKKGEDLPENRKWNRRVELILTDEPEMVKLGSEEKGN
jgi:outer membrane protein OmpA-like peptidoglycan-associated protein